MQDVFDNVLQPKLPITLVVDSKGLHRALATPRQLREASVNASVYQLRLDHMSGLMKQVYWIEGTENPADSLTKTLSDSTAQLRKET